MIKNNSCVSCEYAFYHQDEVPCVDCVNDSHWKQKTHKSDEEGKENSGMTTIRDENPNDENNDQRVKCVCGWKGTLGDLVTDDDELDCPRCGTCGWCFA